VILLACVAVAVLPFCLMPQSTMQSAIGALMVQFDGDVVRRLLNYAFNSSPNEFAGCLYGGVRADTVLIIDSIAPAVYLRVTPNTVQFDPEGTPQGCESHDRYLGSIHTHGIVPGDRCRLSSPDDYATWLADPRAAMAAVVCSDGGIFAMFRDGKVVEMRWRP
jgi:hypothetical protein